MLPDTTAPSVRHALSVDVEDWYHDGGQAAADHRVEAHTERLLELFGETGARATFFVLGEVAQRCPGLVRRLADAGHEIGSHGYQHRPVSTFLRSEFRADAERSRALLEDIIGRRIAGYRAPYFSIKAGVAWPIETLRDLGFGYDSSILAIDRPPGLELVCPRQPFRHAAGLWEVPVGVMRMLLFWHLPLASGAGLRLLPRGLFWRCVEQFEHDVGAGVFYLHPWELDPTAPTGSGAGRWLLRIGRAHLAERLALLLRAREFAPIGEVFPGPSELGRCDALDASVE